MFYVKTSLTLKQGDWSNTQETLRKHKTIEDAMSSIRWGLEMAGKVDGDGYSTSYTVWEERDGIIRHDSQGTSDTAGVDEADRAE